MTDLVEFIKSVGVPAGIAFFVLYRLDQRFAELVAEFRHFRQDVKDSLTSVAALEKHVSNQADRVIREVMHDVRGALGNHELDRKRP